MQTADVVVDETKDLAAVEITILVYGSSYSFYSVAEMDLAEAGAVAATTVVYGSLSCYSVAAEMDLVLAAITTVVVAAAVKEISTTLAASSHTIISWSDSLISFFFVLARNFFAYILTT